MANPGVRSTVDGVQKASGHPKFPTSQVAGFAGLVIFGLLGLTSGLSGVVIFLGVYVMGTGVYALVRRKSWLGTTTRKTATGILAGGFVLLIAGGAVAGPTASPRAGAPTIRPSSSSSPSTGSTPTPTPTELTLAEQGAALPAPELAPVVDVASVGATAAPQTALATAVLLDVKGRAPKTGYTREQFGAAWTDTDGNGCDQRNDVLGRDLTAVTRQPGTPQCMVLTGNLADPYSGTNIAFQRGQTTSSAIQIDHVVALSDAWQKGAQQWDAGTRVKFANDFVNLLAVDGPLNAQKGDGDTATWLPPNKAFRCQYVARQVGVKFAYSLWVTPAEQNAMVSILSGCPNQPLPGGVTPPPAPAPAPAPAPPVAPAPVPLPAAPPAPAPAPVDAAVHPGAFCSPEGALGHTTAGTLMRCSLKAGDTRARWRAA